MDPPWYHRIASLACDADFSREKDKLKQEIRLLWFRLGKKKAEEAEREVEHLADEGFDDAWDDIDVDEDDDAICEKPVKRKDERIVQKIVHRR